jgi:hypothetical protein
MDFENIILEEQSRYFKDGFYSFRNTGKIVLPDGEGQEAIEEYVLGFEYGNYYFNDEENDY